MSKVRLHRHDPGHGPGSGGGPHDPDEETDAGGTPPPGASGERRTKHPWAGRLELIITILLGLAAIAGAYAALKNEKRDHEAAAQFSDAVRNYDNGGQFYAEGTTIVSRDQSLFLEYTKAIQLGQHKLASYIFENLMEPRLQAAIHWWLGPNHASSSPAKTPFSDRNTEYKVPQLADADQSYAASERNFSEARAQQDKASEYTLVEVILATALFLYGIAGVSRAWTLKLGTLISGSLIFLIALVLLVTD